MPIVSSYDFDKSKDQGPTPSNMQEVKIFNEAMSGFGLFAPLEDRIKQVIGNLASNDGGAQSQGTDNSLLGGQSATSPGSRSV